MFVLYFNISQYVFLQQKMLKWARQWAPNCFQWSSHHLAWQQPPTGVWCVCEWVNEKPMQNASGYLRVLESTMLVQFIYYLEHQGDWNLAGLQYISVVVSTLILWKEYLRTRASVYQYTSNNIGALSILAPFLHGTKVFVILLRKQFFYPYLFFLFFFPHWLKSISKCTWDKLRLIHPCTGWF